MSNGFAGFGDFGAQFGFGPQQGQQQQQPIGGFNQGQQAPQQQLQQPQGFNGIQPQQQQDPMAGFNMPVQKQQQQLQQQVPQSAFSTQSVQNQQMQNGFNTQPNIQMQHQIPSNQFGQHPQQQQQPNGFSQFEGFGNPSFQQGQQQQIPPQQQGQGFMQQPQQQQQQPPQLQQQMAPGIPQQQMMPGQPQQQQFGLGQSQMVGGQQVPQIQQGQMNMGGMQQGQVPMQHGQQQGMMMDQFAQMNQQQPQQQQGVQYQQQPPPTVDQFGNFIAPQQQLAQGGAFEAPRPQKLRVKLENSERGVYSALYTQVDPEELNTVKIDKALEFFQRSGLDKQTIRNIMQIFLPQDAEATDRDGFYVGLRLVAYAQNGIEVSEQSILQNIKAPQNPKIGPKKQPQTQAPIVDPQFNNGFNTNAQAQGGQFVQQPIQQQPPQPPTPYSVSVEQNAKYEKYFDVTDVNKLGYITGLQAKQIFTKSQLPNDVLKLIWTLVDQEKKGNLNKYQFAVMVHLVQLAKNSIPIPPQLPQELLKFISSQGKSIQQPNTGFQQQAPNNFPQQQQPVMQAQPANVIPPQQAAFNGFPTQSPQPPRQDNFNTSPVVDMQMQQQPPQIVNEIQPPVVQNSNFSSPNPSDKYSAFNNMDLMNTPPTTQVQGGFQQPQQQQQLLQPQQQIQPQIQPLVSTNIMGGDFPDMNRLSINAAPAQGVVPQQQQLSQSQMIQPALAMNNNPAVNQQQQAEFSMNLQNEQQKLSNAFEDMRNTHSSFIDQQNKNLDIFTQIIDAYTKTNKKFQDENQLLKEDIKGILEKQQLAIQQLTEIGKNFHLNLQESKQLRQEVVQTAADSITAITAKASEMLQRSSTSQNYQADGNYNNNGYRSDQSVAYIQNQQQQQSHPDQGGFNNAQGFENNAGFDVSSHFNNSQVDNSIPANGQHQQQQWGGGFENSHFNNDNGNFNNNNNANSSATQPNQQESLMQW